jgi:hypothetical protein
MMGTQMSTIKTATCPKCDGKKTISGFSHICDGICFRCKGAGVVKAYKEKPIPPASEYTLKLIDTIKNADLSKMSFGQLGKLRDFAHWPCPYCHDILKIWKARGDQFFFAAQEIEHERLYNR